MLEAAALGRQSIATNATNPTDIHEKPADRSSFRYLATSDPGKMRLHRIMRRSRDFFRKAMFQDTISLAKTSFHEQQKTRQPGLPAIGSSAHV